MDILTQISDHILDLAKQNGLIAGLKVEAKESQSDLLFQLADRIYLDFVSIKPINDLDDIKKDLIRGFVYMFDKGVEISYLSRLNDDPRIEYNFGDLLDGMSGDKVPVYIQERVNQVVGVLAGIYKSALEYIDNISMNLYKSNIQTEQLVKLLLISGAIIGVEFCSRIDVRL